MSKKILLLSLLFVCFTQAQEKKYQSLLWEISGNGLQKNSYIYGSMHVSEKVSYHLSDAFFKHLMEADFIANESDPATWSDLYNIFGNMYGSNYGYGAFYTNFYITKPKKEELYPLFQGTNYNLIGLLSRTNEMKKDYQEDTYLDMFIYRTGRKYGKKTLGLEDVKSSTINIMEAEAKVKPKDVEENRQKLIKLLKNKNYNEAMMDYYREKDLDMLDSLTILSSSENYLKAMLYDRNTDMVKSMDSIMKTGSLFSAIGAAHLPGKNGVIEALRTKGYTVNPVYGEYTDEGRNTKKQIEEYFIKPEFETKTTTDGMLSLPLYKLVLESGENLESPDLANGGYINIKRSLLKDFLGKDNDLFNHKSLDSLFYENIPGDILDKKFYNEKNYLVYDIKSKTKTNNAQRYRYYITPLEIIAVIMGGEGDYVRQYESYVFDNIQIKDNSNAKEKFVAKKGGFEVEIPSYYITQGNKDFDKQYADIKIYAYDSEEKANYFLIENTLGDNDNLEDSEFELKRIHYEFYNQHDLDSTNTFFNKEKMFFTSSSKIGEKEIYLKNAINGSKYYLLGTVGASKSKADSFFDSFTLKSLSAEVETKIYEDKTAMFTVEIPKKQNEYLDFRFDRAYDSYEKKENIFKVKSKAFSFISPTGKDVELSFYQYHKYGSEKNLDSVWNEFREHIKSDFASYSYDDISAVGNAVESATMAVEAAVNGEMIPADLNLEATDDKMKLNYYISRWDEELGFNKKDKNKIELINEQLTSNEDKTVHEMNVLAVKPNSNQAIKYKAVFKDGMSYLMKTLVEKDYKNDDAFVEKTFNSFKPFDTIISPSIFENKFQYFVEDAYSESDTIRYSALKSISFLEITKEDLPQVKEFLEGFEFAQDENDAIIALYQKIGQIKDLEIIPYLENIYKKENVTTSIQFAILNALTNQKNKDSYKVIAKLLEYDLPLSDNEYEVSSLFSAFEYDIENSQILFPDIFQFYSVNEYHTPIIDFTNKLIESNLGNPKKLKTYKKMLLTNAKLEYKRVLSWKQKQDMQENDGYGYDDENNAPTEELSSYLNILYPFKKEKAVAELYAKVDKLNVDNLNISLAKIQLDKNNEVDKKTIEKLLAKPETKFVAFQLLHHTKQLEELYTFSEDSIALSSLRYFDKLKKDKAEITFLEKRIIKQDNKEIHFFFYKVVDIDEDSYTKNAEIISGIGFVMENGKINPQAYKKLQSKTIIEEKEIEPHIKSVIDESINTNHPRATYQKQSDDYNMYGDYNEQY